MTFSEKLEAAVQTHNSSLCVGLDPNLALLPDPITNRDRTSTQQVALFLKKVIDATKPHCAAYKPNLGFFEALGPDGWDLLAGILDYIPNTKIVIADAKRGDISSTAEHYAREAFGRYGAHAVTVNPYLGTDAVAPYFEHGGGVIALCRTSNAGGADIQSLVADGKPVYAHVAEMVATQWTPMGDCGLVVGATYPAELAEVRALAPSLPLLVPGVGAQGGDAGEVVAAGADARGGGLIVNASRAVSYASGGSDFADAARAEAERLAASLRLP